MLASQYSLTFEDVKIAVLEQVPAGSSPSPPAGTAAAGGVNALAVGLGVWGLFMGQGSACVGALMNWLSV